MHPDFDRLLDGSPGAEEAWYAAVRDYLERAYLAASDPVAASGKSGGMPVWEQARHPIVSAIDRDGTFLDVGCANGLLMESMVAWADANGYAIEPYGLDISAALVRLAQQRLPRWADRIWVGNVMTWRPPCQFDFVRTELVYVPSFRRRELAHRLFTQAVAPGGRLILCSYGSSRGSGAEPLDAMLSEWGYRPAGYAEATADTGVIITRVVWIERPAT